MQDTPVKNSESNFITLLNFIIDPAVIVDEKGHFLVVNDAFVSLIGLKPKELIGTAFFDISLLTAESKATLLRNLTRRMNGLHVEPYEINFTDKTGENRYAEVKAKKIDYIGLPADLVLFRDITRRKRNEKRLKEYSEKMATLVDEKVKEIRESEEKFRAISTYSMNAIVLLDVKDKIAYWNPAAERIFGYKAEEAVGKKLQNLVVPPESRKNHLLLLEKLVTQKGEISEKRVEIKALRNDGTEFPIELSATAVKLGNALYVLEIIQDVSERKKLEAELKQERNMLEAVTENIGAGLVVVGKDYHILWTNNLMKQIAGDIENKLCYPILGRSNVVCPDCGVRKVFDEGATVDRHDYFFKDDKGHEDWVELIDTPIKDKDGKVVAVLELAVTITERKKMQDKLAEYSQKLEKLVEERTKQLEQTQAKLVKSERLAAIGELAAMVGHDLRNPLTGIKGATYYLKNRCSVEINGKGKEMLATIDECIDQSNKIINDLLEYSRESKLETVETNPKALLANSVSMITIPRNIQVITDAEAEPNIMADVDKMSRVFVNIIKNSIDAMPDGGILTITSKVVDDSVVITFTDTGVGMSEETLSKLGSPLFTTKAKGMGFGLPICRRMLEAHGGSLSVESEVGKGTTVRVIIPVNSNPTVKADATLTFNDSMVSATS
jgi:PAS domain S-box-containing protein